MKNFVKRSFVGKSLNGKIAASIIAIVWIMMLVFMGLFCYTYYGMIMERLTKDISQRTSLVADAADDWVMQYIKITDNSFSNATLNNAIKHKNDNTVSEILYNFEMQNFLQSISVAANDISDIYFEDVQGDIIGLGNVSRDYFWSELYEVRKAVGDSDVAPHFRAFSNEYMSGIIIARRIASYDDYYKFELKDKFTNPHLYIKETENDSIDYIQIFDRNRNSVYYSKVNTLLDEDLNTELTKGTYYLYVKGNFVGKYSFKLTKTYFGWMQGKYWYENGVRQAVPGDPKNITDTIYGHERGREIYDPDSDGWYWLDAIYDGAKATSKEVWMPYIYQNEKPGSTLGKWVRYDENGKMYKGLVTIDYWYENPEQNGNTYYYEPITGGMIKGYRNIDGKDYYFDEFTGVLR